MCCAFCWNCFAQYMCFLADALMNVSNDATQKRTVYTDKQSWRTINGIYLLHRQSLVVGGDAGRRLVERGHHHIVMLVLVDLERTCAIAKPPTQLRYRRQRKRAFVHLDVT